jgi:hypothetical protein
MREAISPAYGALAYSLLHTPNSTHTHTHTHNILDHGSLKLIL